MTQEASWAVQKAVYAALTADAGLKSLIGDPARVYDDPPADAGFPYLTLGEGRVEEFGGVPGALQHDLRLYAYSRYAGRREVKRIKSVVYDVLHEADLTVAGHRLVDLRYVFADVWRRQDGDTYQGVMRYRALTEPMGAAA